MIEKHQYIGATLSLFFNYNYEFGGFKIPKDKSYLETIQDYIKKIGYKGSKIVIMVGSIIVLTLRQTGNTIAIDNYLTDSLTKTEVVEIKKEEPKIEIKEGVPEVIQEVKSIPTLKENTISKNNTVTKDNTTPKVTEKKGGDEPKKEETKQEAPKEEPKQEVIPEHTWEHPITLIHNGKSETIELEDYVLGVVAAEMPASFHIEALKAQAIIARTYALNLISKGNTLTDSSTIQEYIDANIMQSKWGSSYQTYYNKIKNAVSSTKGQTIKYNGKYIDAVYHSTSNGYTEDSINVWNNNIPYLKSVDSSWDKNATSYLREKSMSLEEFNRILGTSISSNEEVEVLSKTSGNRIDKIKLGDISYTGLELRTILNLRSTDFDININDNNVVMTTRGYGHGVGLSQYGANGMASNGYNYKQILEHYYQGVIVN